MKPTNEKTALLRILSICRSVAGSDAVIFRLHNGEEWLNGTTDIPTVAQDANSTGEDLLRVFDAEGRKLGTFTLVWGNADDGEELISDYGINAFTETVWERFNELYA